MTSPLSNPLRFIQQENARLNSENDELKAQLGLVQDYLSSMKELHQACLKLRSEKGLLNYLGQTLDVALHVTNSADGSLLLIDSDTQELVFVQVRGTQQATLPSFRLKQGEGVAGWVAANREPQIVNDPYHDERFQRRVDESFKFITHNMMVVPIIGFRGVLGVVEVLNKIGEGGFTPFDLDLLIGLANSAAHAIERLER
jgi:GAF domain-containing protein